MILVDSSGWTEYFAARPKADAFAPYIEGAEPLVASVIQLYEIYQVVRRDLGEDRAIDGAGRVQPGTHRDRQARAGCATVPGPAFRLGRIESG